MKKILTFIIILLPWFLSALFMDTSFYKTINLPSFAPKPIVFAIVWPILYILIAISIYKVYEKVKLTNKSYLYTLLINYIFNQSFTFMFFYLKSPFLGLLATLGTLISSLFLFNETREIDKQASYFLIPYILWNAFATILSFAIFLLNL